MSSVLLVSLPLQQSWLPAPDPRFQPGTATLAWTPEFLSVQADFADAEIFTRATADDQPLHLLGDTLEIFLQVENAPFYVELHVSPLNHRAHLRWPRGAIDQVRSGERKIDDFRLAGNAFRSEAALFPQGNRWKVQAMIPPEVLGLERFSPGLKLRFAVARYDYFTGNPQPVHSSTALHPVLNFHRTEDWHRLEIGKPT